MPPLLTAALAPGLDGGRCEFFELRFSSRAVRGAAVERPRAGGAGEAAQEDLMRAQLVPIPTAPGILPRVSTSRRVHHQYEDYVRVLELSPIKLEYCEGEIYAMAGGTPAHADLAASMMRLLGNALLGRCRVSSSDLKVRVEATDLSTFPDVTVVCGGRELSVIDPNAVTNPTMLVEVTSPSTEDYDRGDKLGHYKQLESIRVVLVVSHRRAQVTVIERSPQGWAQREYRAGEQVTLENPAVSFAVDELYDGIALDETR